MSSRLSALAILGCLCAGSALAQSPIEAPAKILTSVRAITVAADGSSTMTTHNEVQILSQAAIGTLAQTALDYSDGLQQLDVTQAYTKKADGRVLAVAPEAIITQQSPAAKGSPMLSDLKQKVILYPNVDVGDTLVYTTVTRSKPLIPGNFSFNLVYPSVLGIDNATTTITVPRSLSVTTDDRDLPARRSVAGGDVVYTIQYANPRPVYRGLQAVSEFDRAPRFSLSTFKDYDALAKTYAALVLPAMAVTPAIQSEADKITDGVSDRYQQARLLYEWVSNHVRYVALEFGQGGIVPHNADNVLVNAYGDCKDHAVLFTALLKAKGIDSNMAIINASNSYTVSETANLSPFNHVITWLPEFKLYADTTNGRNEPFGLLPRGEYGKPVIHIADPGGALHQVPVAEGENSTDSYKLTMRMDDAGHLESESSSTGTGNFAAPMRVLGALMQGDNGKKFATTILTKSRMPHATGAFMAPPPNPDDPQYRISATYAPQEPLAPLAAGTSFKLGDNLQLINPVSATFFGAILDPRYKNADPVTCYSGRSVDEETLEFPASRHLEKLPDDNSVKTSHLSYISHWSQTPTSVTVRREFEARFDRPLCNASVRDEVLLAYAKIQHDIAAATIAVPRD